MGFAAVKHWGSSYILFCDTFQISEMVLRLSTQNIRTELAQTYIKIKLTLIKQWLVLEENVLLSLFLAFQHWYITTPEVHLDTDHFYTRRIQTVASLKHYISSAFLWLLGKAVIKIQDLVGSVLGWLASWALLLGDAAGLRLVLTFLQWLILCGETGNCVFSCFDKTKTCTHIGTIHGGRELI